MTGQTSVIIACYNGEAYLLEALESVRGQTRAVREIIVVDDGSDRPIQIPTLWKGPPLRIIRTENRGAAAARNLGVSLATGSFIAFLDADDAWAPTKIEMQEAALSSRPGSVAVFTQRVEKPGWPPCVPMSYPSPGASHDEFWASLWQRDFIILSSVMVRRDTLLRVGGFNEGLRYCEDQELWFRLLSAGQFIQVALPLCYRRIHPRQMTRNSEEVVVYRRKWRLSVMLQYEERLAAAGISQREQRERAREEYREDLLALYFRREFSKVRRLFWGYVFHYPSDARFIKYAILSLLPRRFFITVRDRAGLGCTLDAGADSREK